MVNILEGILLYFYGHLTMGKLNPALLSNNVIENCLSLITMFI